MFIEKKVKGVLFYLRRLYQGYPKSFSFVELIIYTGIFVFNVWIVPFWFWGIYRLNLPFPEGLETLFYGLWHKTTPVRAISLALGLCVLALSFFIRGESFKELGIRVDNLYRSGRECAIASLISISLIAFVGIYYFDKSYAQVIASPVTRFLSYSPWGLMGWIGQRTAQQFLLQSVILTRFFQIFEKKVIALVSAAMLFSFAHAPNPRLMILSFVFGLLCCILFLRNRNIFTLGMMHNLIVGFLFSLLVPGLMDNLSVGSWRGNTEFVAELDYDGSKVEAKPLEKKDIKIYVRNRSTAVWNSRDEEHPVFISYHLLDAKGDMITHDNIRTPFPRMMRTDDSAFVDLSVHTPAKKGDYYLEVDVVKEKVAWFENKGSKTILIPLSVN